MQIARRDNVKVGIGCWWGLWMRDSGMAVVRVHMVSVHRVPRACISLRLLPTPLVTIPALRTLCEPVSLIGSSLTQPRF